MRIEENLGKSAVYAGHTAFVRRRIPTKTTPQA